MPKTVNVRESGGAPRASELRDSSRYLDMALEKNRPWRIEATKMQDGSEYSMIKVGDAGVGGGTIGVIKPASA